MSGIWSFRISLLLLKPLFYRGNIRHGVGRQGYSAATPARLQSRLAPLAQSESGEQLRAELADFVTEQSAHAQAGERFPGSTEILESSFGKLKLLSATRRKAASRICC